MAHRRRLRLGAASCAASHAKASWYDSISRAFVDLKSTTFMSSALRPTRRNNFDVKPGAETSKSSIPASTMCSSARRLSPSSPIPKTSHSGIRLSRGIDVKPYSPRYDRIGALGLNVAVWVLIIYALGHP